MILEIVSVLTGRKIVVLRRHDGGLIRTLQAKRLNPFTKRPWCYAYWFVGVVHVDLLENGKTSGIPTIIEWTYQYEKTEGKDNES